VKLYKKQSGFTLIELLVVIAIIGIITSLVLVSLGGARARARDAARAWNLRHIEEILELYQLEHGLYPLSTDDNQIENHPWGSVWSGYGSIPNDPLPDQPYAYISDGWSFRIYAKFEILPVDPTFACDGPCGPGAAYNGGILRKAWGSTEGDVGGGLPGGGGSSVVCDPPVAPGEQSYTVSVPRGDNPQIKRVFINPLNVNIYGTQTVNVYIQETNGYSVTEVTGLISTNSMTFPFTFSLASGTDIDGNWYGYWTNEDEYCENYMLTITATSISGTSRVVLTFK
jgi:prepilin-type N-terminal cleavage/methylation domain-containing protein